MASISPLWVKITDFGISKRWDGTQLQTQCGTPLYQAPELIGLLPRSLRSAGQMYTWSVDIWALCAVVYQLLTSEIVFTEVVQTLDDSDFGSMAMGSSIDGESLLDYCAGRKPFPIERLTYHGASAIAINFVKSLMAPDPNQRLSARTALGSVWLTDLSLGVLSRPDTPPILVSVSQDAVQTSRDYPLTLSAFDAVSVEPSTVPITHTRSTALVPSRTHPVSYATGSETDPLLML